MYIALSTYKSNTYTYLDVKRSNTQTENICTRARTHIHTPIHSHTNTHLNTHRLLGAGGLKKRFSKRERFSRKI